MKTELEWKKDILKILISINQHYPSLAEFNYKMPVKISKMKNNGKKINYLEEYYYSLEHLFNSYSNSSELLIAKIDTNNAELQDYPLHSSSKDTNKLRLEARKLSTYRLQNGLSPVMN